MNINPLKSLVILGTIATILGGNMTAIKAEEGVKFFCGSSYEEQTNKREFTTFILKGKGKIRFIQWVKNLGNFPPEKRCKEVSERFQTAYNNGTLGLITNGKMNGKSVICTAKNPGGKCHTLLMTLREKDDSLTILNELKDLFVYSRTVGPIKHSSGKPQIYYQIDLNKFLQNAPVEK